MKRRDFITVLGGAAAWPVAARAQQAVPIIGFLSATSSAQWTPYVDAFTQGLNETGYRVSQNVAVEYRWANGQYNLLPGLAAEFVRMRVGVIIAVAPPAALAAKAATSTVPIVFSSGLDPVRLGLVTSYNKPGGNVTGVNFFTAELGPKALEILLEVTPNIKSIGFLANPDNANTASQLADLNTASAKRGYQLQAYYANSPETIENAFKTLAEQVGAIIVATDAFFISRRSLIVSFAEQFKVPAIYYMREYPAAGGLMSYGISVVDVYKDIGRYAGKILHGAKPSELPVLQPTKFELVVNLKAAKSLGLAIPETFLVRADEVIE